MKLELTAELRDIIPLPLDGTTVRRQSLATEKHMKIEPQRQRGNWAKGSLNLAEKILLHDLVTQTLKYGGGDNARELKIIKKKLESELGL